MYICQVNVSEIRHPVTDPRFLKFSAGAQVINRKVAMAQGYICGDQMYDDDTLFITRSVWQSAADLAAFVYSGTHQKFMAQAANWFKPVLEPSLALWYSDSPALPGVAFCLQQLALLRRDGEGDNLKGKQWLLSQID